MTTSRLLLMSIAAAIAISTAAPAQSQPWPQRAVRIIVPFVAGGLTDDIARLIAQKLSEELGQRFIVENLAGASGAIAARTVARAPADGYTLLLASPVQIAVLPAFGDTSYQPVKDLAPISIVANAPFVLMINSKFPAGSLSEFVTYVRGQSGKITYASSGTGSLAHLAMALLLRRAGIDMIHVPYKGGAGAVTDLVAGHVSAYFGTLTDALQQMSTGAIRPLAVSGDQPAAQLPGVPTVAESGFPGFRIVVWNGLMAPAGTPQGIIDTLADKVQHSVEDQAFVDRLIGIGVNPIGNRPSQFAATISADVPLWAETVHVAGVKSQ